VAALARESLKFTALEKAPAERDAPADLFIHSTIFALVDKEARLRAFYETEGDDIDPVRLRTRILADIHRLERE
jgi:cytochrome oxidase Cu insertion factor (SCO1/SenC/PrrC family)